MEADEIVEEPRGSLMPSQFEPAFQKVLQLEGGYAEPPQVEQPTNMGITQTDWDEYRQRSTGPLPTNVKDITTSDARGYYFAEWWNTTDYQAINDQGLCNLLFQTDVLSGQVSGIELLQRALVELGDTVTVDGDLGPLTVAATNKEKPQAVMVALRVVGARHYLQIAHNDPQKMKYLVGWMERALNE